MHRMRSHYDPQRIMLPVRELRQYEWVFVTVRQRSDYLN
jgi:hypothetical protein